MLNLKIAFFTEAGSKRGMGHLVRCYTIFSEYQKYNNDVRFFLNSDINFDYKFDCLEYFSWENLEVFDVKEQYDLVFIDSYEANLNVYQNLSKCTKTLVVVDDYGRLNYPESIILNFAPDAKKLFFPILKDKYHYLLGLDYIPIRKKFYEIKKKKENRIFIMLGGADTSNLSVEIIEILKDIDITKVLVINNDKNIDHIQQYRNVQILYKPTDDELIINMANSSIAITTASMTVYELNYLQVPTIIIATSENQHIGLSQLINHQIANYSINIKSDYKDVLIQYINNLMHTYNTIQKIDGYGVKRIIEQTMKLVNK